MLFAITDLLVGCAGLPPAKVLVPSFTIDGSESTALGRLATKDAPPSPLVISGFTLLSDATFALEARIALIRHAERSLDVQYYLIRNDDVGLLLLKELRHAAARGVRVRLLVDDLYAAGADEVFRSLAAFSSVEVRLFNPLPSRAAALPLRLSMSLLQLPRLNHRMHNKLLVADNSFAVTGGRNIANEYFMRDTAANFIDVDVMASGPIVDEMSRTFDSFWNSEYVRTISEIVPSPNSSVSAQRRFDELTASALSEVQLPVGKRDILDRPPVGEQIARGEIHRHWAQARLFADRPDKLMRDHVEASRESVLEGAFDAIATSKREVKIISPYFIPGVTGVTALARLVAAGGRVTVITNSLGSTDEPLAYAGYERYRADLLKIGATIYEIAPDGTARTRRFGDFGKSISRLHAKVALFDHDRIFIGSMNLDHRSAAINTELGLLIDSASMVTEFNKLIDAEHIELGYRLRLSPDGRRTQWLGHGGDNDEYVVHEDVPGSFLWLRFKNWILLNILGEELL